MNNSAKLMILAIMLLMAVQSAAVTSTELYNDGTRAFNNARWQEAEEVLTRFIDTWPDHLLRPQALYYKAIASTRNVTGRINSSLASSAEQWKSELAQLKNDLPGKDLSELQVAIDIANRHNEQPSWQALSDLKPVNLKHYLQRGWHPDSAAEPMAALSWSNDWLKKHTSTLDPDLESRIQLIRARAFWQLLLSPLSLNANSDILKTWGCWPVHNQLEKSLNRGFSTGSAEIKRHIALLGYHFDFFRERGVTGTSSATSKSRWYSYLSERGINLQEAWCPR
ncbi:MAG: hypothetical protein CVV41_03855 [Candidatus Riflebacteria bacterium HGW-Riflebacteria-1]|jgi:hypothetical protein|nr:MAG: hypothetical protein CVV41_03855 [Candidatus Riflebacteria bacterium HGW-Riflebacteria-1]